MKQYFQLYSVEKVPEVFAIPSLRMIKTLKQCLQIETSVPRKPYGPADIKGSFFGLYKRGYLDIHLNYKNRLKPDSWYVTRKGLLFLLSNLTETSRTA